MNGNPAGSDKSHLAPHPCSHGGQADPYGKLMRWTRAQRSPPVILSNYHLKWCSEDGCGLCLHTQMCVCEREKESVLYLLVFWSGLHL